MNTDSKVRAFRSYDLGVDAIVFASTREQARYKIAAQAQASFLDKRYTDVKVSRAPEYDARMYLNGNSAPMQLCHNPMFLERN